MPLQNITAEANVGQQTVSVIEAEWKTRKIHDASLLNMKVLPDDPLEDLGDAQRCRLFINGETIASGSIFNATFNEDGSQTIKALDAAKKLKQFKYTGNFDEDPARLAYREVCDKALVAYGTDLNTEQYERAGGIDANTPFTFDANDETCWAMLNKIAFQTEWTWYVDADDTVWLANDIYTSERYNDRRPMATKEITNVIERGEGQEVPPYQKVVVTGDSVSERNEGSIAHRLSKTPAFGAAQTDLWGPGDPIYTHVDRSIKTADQAVNQAKQILKSFRNKRKGGEITIPGRADIRPFDIVTMPSPNENERFYGESYLVFKLDHKLTPSDGFKTTIYCGGLLDEGEGWLTTSKPQLSPPPERTVNIDDEQDQQQEQEQEQEQEEKEEDQRTGNPDNDGRRRPDQGGDSRPDSPQEGDGTPDEDATIDPPSLPSGSDPEPDDVRTPGGRNDFYPDGEDGEDDEDDNEEDDESGSDPDSSAG